MGPPRHEAAVVLQRFVTDRPLARRPLYWRDLGADSGDTASVICRSGELSVAFGGVLRFDTYFNAFFEAQWRRYTTLQTLDLQVTLAGVATLRVYRHALDCKSLLVEQLAGPGLCTVRIPPATLNFRQYGLLTLELTATEDDFTFGSGAWVTRDAPIQDIGLAAVFCTFNREEAIGRVLTSLAADPAAQARLARVFVVDQGRAGLLLQPAVAEAANRLGNRLTVIEQGNFGGAGGFSRGMLAALADPAITHVALLDDDIDVEPDSLLRMAAFFSFCERDIVLGGHMLDLMHPTMLYEAGAVISERHWEFLPQHFMVDVGSTPRCEMLSRPYAVHYNGWWCCGFPLSVVREHGMPLPCFIRGDDMEFGLRLHQRGVPTVPMPGIAVWHEPFYLKLGGWQLYYETRNLLVAASLHQPFDRKGVVRRVGRQIVTHLLTYRYYSTALILKGVADYLDGPAVMRAPPLPLHTSLNALKQAYPPGHSPREHVAHEQQLRTIPRGRLRCLALLAWLLVRNAVLPTCTAPPRHMPVEKLHWLTVRNAGHIAIETWWDESLPSYRRTREHHRTLLREAAVLLVRLARELPRAARAWRDAAPQLTSVPAWHDYLGLKQATAPAATSTEPVAVTAAQ